MKLKEQLVAMGMTEEIAQKVIDEIFDGNFVPKSRFNEVNEENKQLKASVSERDKQLETLKKANGDNEALQNQIKELQEANIQQLKAHEAEMTQLKLDTAINAALTEAGAKNILGVRAVMGASSDLSKMKLLENGTVEGLKEAIAAVQKSDPYMFKEQEKGGAKFVGFEPGASDDSKPSSTVDMSKMSYDELAAYIENNPGAAS